MGSSQPQPPGNRLGEATFYDLAPDRVDGIKLLVRAATAPTYYVESYYYGNPGFYQHYLAGLNECGPFNIENELLVPLLGPPIAVGSFAGSFDDYDADELEHWLARQEMETFRKSAVPNTYGLTAPGFSPMEYGPDFPLGPDPVQMRTI